jgi:hypothetical protein
MKKPPSPRVRRIRGAYKNQAQLKFSFAVELDKGSTEKQRKKN